MNDSGWISLYRSLLDHWLWQGEKFTKGQAWVDLLLLANYREVKRQQGDTVVAFKPGTVNRSIESLAKRWRWGREKTRRFLSALESDGMVVVNATTNRTTITIVNYSDFQNRQTTNRATNRQRTEQRVDSEPTQTINNNNSNNVNNAPDGDTHTDEPEEDEEEEPKPMYVNDPEATQRKYEEAIKKLRGGRFDA